MNVDRLLLNVLYQATGEDQNGIDFIDTEGLKDYEEACEYLTQKGLLKKIGDRTYRVIK